MEMSLSKLQERVKDREAWHAAVHGAAKSWTQLSDWTVNNLMPVPEVMVYGNLMLEAPCLRDSSNLLAQEKKKKEWHIPQIAKCFIEQFDLIQKKKALRMDFSGGTFKLAVGTLRGTWLVNGTLISSDCSPGLFGDFYTNNIWLIYLNQFSCSVMSDSLWPHEPQHVRLLCLSSTPRVYLNSCHVMHAIYLR